MPRTLYQDSKFTSKNETEASLAWGGILAGHGIVSITPEYATQRNLPPTSPLPDGNGNLAYVIEAYHAIHCVVSSHSTPIKPLLSLHPIINPTTNHPLPQARIRTHYMLLKNGHPTTWPLAHDVHCFDAVRQYIMCNADDTLLWTNGDHSTGTHQAKKCVDWDALREWAEERAAGYYDYEDNEESEREGKKHVGTKFRGDGLPVGSL